MTPLLTVLLAACAGGLLAAADRPGARLAQVLSPTAPRAPASALHPRLGGASAVLLGAAVVWLVGGVAGAVAGAGAAWGCAWALRRADRPPDDGDAVAAELPLLLELLAACLAGGAAPLAAVDAVAAAADGPAGERLRRVSASLAVGCPPVEAWNALGTDGPAAAAARALARASDGGTPVAAAVQRVAEDARREARARAEQRARRAGVLAVGPLGLCFLPAFLLLGVLPTVVGLAGPLLDSLT